MIPYLLSLIVAIKNLEVNLIFIPLLFNFIFSLANYKISLSQAFYSFTTLYLNVNNLPPPRSFPLPPHPPLSPPPFFSFFFATVSCASQIFHNFWKVFQLLLSSVLFLHHFINFLHLQVNTHMLGFIHPSFLTSVMFFLMFSLLCNPDNFFGYLFLFLKCLFNYVCLSFSVC